MLDGWKAQKKVSLRRRKKRPARFMQEAETTLRSRRCKCSLPKEKDEEKSRPDAACAGECENIIYMRRGTTLQLEGKAGKEVASTRASSCFEERKDPKIPRQGCP